MWELDEGENMHLHSCSRAISLLLLFIKNMGWVPLKQVATPSVEGRLESPAGIKTETLEGKSGWKERVFVSVQCNIGVSCLLCGPGPPVVLV